MRESKITPGSNVFWESSRFILPEHREALIEAEKEKRKKKKPDLDPQLIEEICFLIQESKMDGIRIIVTVFDEYIVTRIDPQLKQIKLEMNEDQFEWIKSEEIIGVRRA